jgi:hypothetical protein
MSQLTAPTFAECLSYSAAPEAFVITQASDEGPRTTLMLPKEY